MSKGKIDKNSNFFKNLENLYAAKSGIKKPHKEIKKVVEVPQQKHVPDQIQQIPQQIPQQGTSSATYTSSATNVSN